MKTIVYAKRADFADSAKFLQKVFSDVCGIMGAQIEKNAAGKPFLTNGKVEFSLTHTSELYVAALSNAPVGIDAEPLNRKVEYETLARRRFPETEAQAVKRAEDFFYCWTAREAYVKFTGATLAEALRHLSFSRENSTVSYKDQAPCPVRFFQIEDHLVGICAAQPFEPDEIRPL